MDDRLGKFLRMLAVNLGADIIRPYKADPADVDLSNLKADLDTIYRYEADGLLYTGQTHTASYLPRHPVNMIEVALTSEGAERWRSTWVAKGSL